MKLKDLPRNSKAIHSLLRLSRPAREERLRCADAALEVAQFCARVYPDEPAQRIRCEDILGDILNDSSARISWWSRRPGKAGR